MEITRSEEEIARVEIGAYAKIDDEESWFPNASYEQGVVDTLNFLQGVDNDLCILAKAGD